MKNEKNEENEENVWVDVAATELHSNYLRNLSETLAMVGGITPLAGRRPSPLICGVHNVNVVEEKAYTTGWLKVTVCPIGEDCAFHKDALAEPFKEDVPFEQPDAPEGFHDDLENITLNIELDTDGKLVNVEKEIQ